MKNTSKLMMYIVYGIGIWIGFWTIFITLAYIYLMSKNESFSIVRGLPLIFSYIMSGIVYSLLYFYFIKNRVIEASITKDNINLRTIKKEYTFKKHDITEQFYRKLDNSLIIIFMLDGEKIRLRIPNMQNYI